MRSHPVAAYYSLVFAISWGGILIVTLPSGLPGHADDVARLMPFALLGVGLGLYLFKVDTAYPLANPLQWLMAAGAATVSGLFLLQSAKAQKAGSS
jgi:hypothetical protein